jgi:hypothetical protein
LDENYSIKYNNGQLEVKGNTLFSNDVAISGSLVVNGQQITGAAPTWDGGAVPTKIT